MYKNKCTVYASLLSPFLNELENRGLGRTWRDQTDKFAAKNIWWLLPQRIKNKEIYWKQDLSRMISTELSIPHTCSSQCSMCLALIPQDGMCWSPDHFRLVLHQRLSLYFFSKGGSSVKQEAPMWTISRQPSSLCLTDLVLLKRVHCNIYCYMACRNSFYFLPS